MADLFERQSPDDWITRASSESASRKARIFIGNWDPTIEINYAHGRASQPRRPHSAATRCRTSAATHQERTWLKTSKNRRQDDLPRRIHRRAGESNCPFVDPIRAEVSHARRTSPPAMSYPRPISCARPRPVVALCLLLTGCVSAKFATVSVRAGEPQTTCRVWIRSRIRSSLTTLLSVQPSPPPWVPLLP
jgi:hypothetical protein